MDDMLLLHTAQDEEADILADEYEAAALSIVTLIVVGNEQAQQAHFSENLSITHTFIKLIFCPIPALILHG